MSKGNNRPTAKERTTTKPPKTRTAFKIELEDNKIVETIPHSTGTRGILMEPSGSAAIQEQEQPAKKVKPVKKTKKVKEVATKSKEKKYFFEDLKIKQSFTIPVEDGETVKLVRERAVVASSYYKKRYRKKHGIKMAFKYWEYPDEGFVRIWRWNNLK